MDLTVSIKSEYKIEKNIYRNYQEERHNKFADPLMNAAHS
jgi:hypothetical protein